MRSLGTKETHGRGQQAKKPPPCKAIPLYIVRGVGHRIEIFDYPKHQTFRCIHLSIYLSRTRFVMLILKRKNRRINSSHVPTIESYTPVYQYVRTTYPFDFSIRSVSNSNIELVWTPWFTPITTVSNHTCLWKRRAIPGTDTCRPRTKTDGQLPSRSSHGWNLPHLDSCLKQEAGEAIDTQSRVRSLSRNS